MSGRDAFLDANVFVTTWTLDVILSLADEKLLEPHWTDEVLAEAERAIRRVHSDETDRPRRQIEIYNSAFPLAMVKIEEGDLKGIELPDPGDCHIVAGAMASDCKVIVTYNLKDFPESALAAKSVRAIHPDDFIMGIAEEDSDAVYDAVCRLVESKRRPPRTIDEELAGLRANKLNRLDDFIEDCEERASGAQNGK